MKAFAMPVLCLTLLFAVSLMSAAALREDSALLYTALSEAEYHGEGERWGEAETALNSAYHHWHSRRQLYHIIMEHDLLDETELLFAEAFSACEDQDGNTFHSAVKKLSRQILLVSETQQIALENIL